MSSKRLNQIEEHARRRAYDVLNAVFNARTEDCLVIARAARSGVEPTPEEAEAEGRVLAALRAEMDRAGFDPEAPAVPGLIDGWTAPAPYARRGRP